MNREERQIQDALDALSETKARQDAALGEPWPDNPTGAYRRAREAEARRDRKE